MRKPRSEGGRSPKDENADPRCKCCGGAGVVRRSDGTWENCPCCK